MNEDNALTRAEFIEIIVRVAMVKFRKGKGGRDGPEDNGALAVEKLFRSEVLKCTGAVTVPGREHKKHDGARKALQPLDLWRTKRLYRERIEDAIGPDLQFLQMVHFKFSSLRLLPQIKGNQNGNHREPRMQSTDWLKVGRAESRTRCLSAHALPLYVRCDCPVSHSHPACRVPFLPSSLTCLSCVTTTSL